MDTSVEVVYRHVKAVKVYHHHYSNTHSDKSFFELRFFSNLKKIFSSKKTKIFKFKIFFSVKVLLKIKKYDYFSLNQGYNI